MSSEIASTQGGRVFWLFGLSGSGKSTLASECAAALRAEGTPVLTLDGDQLRSGLCQGLGFDDEDRQENLRRAAEVARLALESRLCVIASFITPLERNRREIVRILGAQVVRFIHVDAPLETCRARDTKGLYARATQGAVTQFTGVSSLFEMPHHVDLTLETASTTVGASTDRLLHYMRTELRR